MNKWIRESRASRDTSWKRQPLERGPHGGGEDSPSKGWEISCRAGIRGGSQGKKPSQVQGGREERWGEADWLEPTTEAGQPLSYVAGLWVWLKAAPEMRIDRKRAARGIEGLQLKPIFLLCPGTMGRLWSLKFYCHWEKNQPRSTDPSTSKETSVGDKRILNK